MKIAVIGPGAIGCLFAGLLAEGRHDVHLIDRRPERSSLIVREGVMLESNGKLRKVPVQAHAFPADAGAVELIILCVKSHETAGTLQSVAALSGKGTAVISLQNGLGHLDVIRPVVEDKNLFAGITTQGATVIGLNHVRQSGTGLTFIGSLARNHEGAEKLAKTLKEAGIEAKATRDTTGMLWSKLIINAAICPISVLSDMTNGEIVRSDKWRAFLARTAEEGAAVAKAKGIKLLYPDPVAATLDVCQNTAGNISSMLQDLRRGRKTEITEINGAIIAAAAELGIATPTNTMLYRNVVELEKSGSYSSAG